MKIAISIIAQALQSFEPQIKLSDEEASYTQLRFFEFESSVRDTLYVGYGRDIDRDRKECAFVTIGEPLVSVTNLIHLRPDCSLQEVYNCLQKVFDQYFEFSFMLYRALVAGSYQDMLEVAQPYLKNPLYLVDSSYRVLAMAPREPIPGDSEWDHGLKYGFISIEAIQDLKDSGHLENLGKHIRPTIFSNQRFKYRSIISNINVEKTFVGRLVILEASTPFAVQELLTAQILTEALEFKMSKDERFLYSRGKGPIYNMFTDLLQGHYMDKRIIEDRLQYLPNWTNGFFQVLTVPMNSGSSDAFGYYANHLSKKMDSYSIFFKSYLTGILHYTRNSDLKKVEAGVAAFLANHGLRGGLSNAFEDLMELKDYANQGWISLGLSKGSQALCLYREHMLEHILSFCTQEKSRLLVHPALYKLIQYDKEYGAELYKTLQILLENERSIVKSAQALYIHRNTLIHRISKIKSLIATDLDSADTRLHIAISFKLLEN